MAEDVVPSSPRVYLARLAAFPYPRPMSEPKDSQFPVPEEQVGAVHGYGPWPLMTLRCIVGGTMMGLALLVPAISGGTMLLAAGIYPRFVQAVAEVSRLEFRKRPLFLLGMVALCAVLALLVLSETVRGASGEYSLGIYSLFMGITVGGLPVVWGLARPSDGRLFAGFLVAFVLMLVLAYVEPSGAVSDPGAGFLFLAGLVAGAAMMLPGISGANILALLGAPGTNAIASPGTATQTGLLPVALGALVGAVVLSNAIARLLVKHEKLTLGAMLGFLCGSVVDMARGTLYGEPSPMQLVWAVGIGFLGFLLTALLAKYDSRDPSERAVEPGAQS